MPPANLPSEHEPEPENWPFNGKRSFTSKARARAAIGKMRRYGEPVWRVYRCACGAWHLSSRRH